MTSLKPTMWRSVLVGISLVFLTGCATEKQTVAAPVYSANSSSTATASSMPGLEQVSSSHSRWISDALNAGNYKHMMIDPVVMKPMPKDLTADQQKRLNDLLATFDGILRAELSSKVSVVDSPADGVARLQPTITGVSSSTQGMKIYEVVPIAAIIGGIKAATGTRGKEVEVAMEANVVDSQTNELLAKVVRKGTADQADRMQANVEDVREILEEWAKEGANSTAKLFN